jgi:hypothetical protein
MKSSHMPPAVQAVGLACVPVDDMPAGTTLARKPVAASVVTVFERDDGHRDVVVQTVLDARPLEWPLPVLINDALVEHAPVIITRRDRDVLAIEAATHRFFVEPALAALSTRQTLVDPTQMFGADQDEAALCRRLGIVADMTSDSEIARDWERGGGRQAERMALTTALSRLTLWAHGQAFRSAVPDPMFETLLPLRERLFELEADYPEVTPILASRPFHRVASFANFYREYRSRHDAGDLQARWVTFEDGTSYF